MVHNGTSHFVRADFPPESFQEVKWASVQRAHDDAATPEALLAAIPDAAPTCGVVLQKVPNLPASWFFNRAALDDIPRLDWAVLYAEGGALRPEDFAVAG